MPGYDPEAHMRNTRGFAPGLGRCAQPQQYSGNVAAGDDEQAPIVCNVHVVGVPPESVSLGIQTDDASSDGQKIIIKLGFSEGDACEDIAYEAASYGDSAFEGTAYESSPQLCAPLTFATENAGLDPDFSTQLSEDFAPTARAGLPSFVESASTPELASLNARQVDYSQADCPQAGCSQVGHSRAQASVQPAEKKKSRVGDVLFYLFLVALVVGAFVLFGGSGNGPRMIAGYSAFTVTTGSMHDVLPQGSLIVTKQVDPETLQIGDDITYMTSETASITHRIVDIVEEYELTGERAFKTKGTMNKSPDAKLVPAVNVVGKVVFCSPALGAAVGFIQSNWPLLIFLAVVASGLAIALKRILR